MFTDVEKSLATFPLNVLLSPSPFLKLPVMCGTGRPRCSEPAVSQQGLLFSLSSPGALMALQVEPRSQNYGKVAPWGPKSHLVTSLSPKSLPSLTFKSPLSQEWLVTLSRHGLAKSVSSSRANGYMGSFIPLTFCWPN